LTFPDLVVGGKAACYRALEAAVRADKNRIDSAPSNKSLALLGVQLARVIDRAAATAGNG
jgi:hypothetical protein